MNLIVKNFILTQIFVFIILTIFILLKLLKYKILNYPGD